MKLKPIIFAAIIVVSLAALSAFIVESRREQDRQYTAWYEILSRIQLDEKEAEKALMASRLQQTSNYDQLSQLSQSLYSDGQRLEALVEQKTDSLFPSIQLDPAVLTNLLQLYRDSIFDFQIELSTLKSAISVFDRNTEEFSTDALDNRTPRLALYVMQLERALLLDQTTTLLEKQEFADWQIDYIEQEFPALLSPPSTHWLTIKSDARLILQCSANVEEISEIEASFRSYIALEVQSLLNQLDAARDRARVPEAIATLLLVGELVGLVVFFVARSSRFSRELKHHAQELENIVQLRTVALETAIEELKDSTAEKEKIAEDLRLSQRLEAIGQLAAGIAHEINTPSQFVNDNLQFILEAHTDLAKVRTAYAEALKNITTDSDKASILEELQDLEEEVDLEFLQDEVPSALQNSLEGMERISKIVKSMKDFSHPGSDGRDLVDLNKTVETTLSVARNEWKYLATVEKDLAEDLPKTPIFQSELNQVLLNIIVNAAHAIQQKQADTGSDELGQIHLHTSWDDTHAILKIRDSGCGIPQKNIDRVFDPFFTTKEVGKGTGQGLSIARKIVVETHGGELQVNSELGEYTEFEIRLPLVVENSEDIPPNSETPDAEVTAGD